MNQQFLAARQAILEYGNAEEARAGIDFEALELIVPTDVQVAEAHRQASRDRERYPNGFGGICCLCGETIDALAEKVVPTTPDRTRLVREWPKGGFPTVASACGPCRAALPMEYALYG